jgi:hypothetical protein
MLATRLSQFLSSLSLHSPLRHGSRGVFSTIEKKMKMHNILQKRNAQGRVEFGQVSPLLFVPPHIKMPFYIGMNTVPFGKREYKTDEQIEKMREVGKLARQVMNFAASLVKVGISTDEIDRQTHQFIISQEAYPSPLGYPPFMEGGKNFPKSISTSVNEILCHGIPDSRKLREGDLLKIDLTVYKCLFQLNFFWFLSFFVFSHFQLTSCATSLPLRRSSCRHV